MKIKIINLTFIQYLKVLIFSLFLILINSFYNFYRYGYFNLYILNKVLSSVAFILLGIVLLLGPASRIFSFPILINSFYNFYRYGYFNLYILNKVLSSVAFILFRNCASFGACK